MAGFFSGAILIIPYDVSIRQGFITSILQMGKRQNKLNKMFKITQLVSFRAEIQTQLSQLWTQVLNAMLNGLCSNAHHALEQVIKEKKENKKLKPKPCLRQVLSKSISSVRLFHPSHHSPVCNTVEIRKLCCS